MANQKEAAAHLFIDTKTFRSLVSDGVLPVHKGRAGYDIDECRKALLAHYRRALRKKKAADKKAGDNVVTLPGSDEDEPEKLSTQEKINREELAKRRRENALADRELAPVALLEEFATQVGNVVRRGLESLPSMIKSQIPHLRGAEVARIEYECANIADRIQEFEISTE